MNIIGLTGKARSGKDTAASMLNAILGGNTYTLAFGQAVKEVVEVAFDLPPGYAFKDENKLKNMPGHSITLREALQKVGTEAFRNVFWQDFWIRRLSRQVAGVTSMGRVAVISDVRFIDEAEYVLNNGGIIIEIQRDGANAGGIEGHRSEQGLPPHLITHVVPNNGELYELHALLRGIIQGLSRD